MDLKYIPLFCSTFTLLVLQVLSREGIKLENIQDQQKAFNANLTGHNLEWIYYRNNEPYYFTGNETTNNRTLRERFKFTPAPDSNGQEFWNQSIELAAAATPTYLWMDPTSGSLSTTGDFAKRSFFQLVPISRDNDRLYIYYNDEPLVTRGSRPPLTFFKQSIYPGEAACEFGIQLFFFDMKDSYRGDRRLILKTARVINELVLFEHRDNAYEQLIQLVKFYGHLPGKEIFELGHYIIHDLGIDSKSFKSLPLIVKVVCSGEPVSLNFPLASEIIPLKNHTAWENHTHILPYTFEGQTDTKTVFWWAITYTTNRQLSYSSDGLTVTLSNIKQYRFQLHLHQDLETFKLAVNINGNPPLILHWLREFYKPEGLIKFVNAANNPEANFTAVPFDLDIGRFYAGKREHIHEILNIIQNKTSFMDKSILYETLVKLMKTFNHFEGKEIFMVAKNIVNDLGTYNSVFYLLPKIVQTIFHDNDQVRLYYCDRFQNGTFPMKNKWASINHTYTLPYTFSPNEGATNWSITYGTDNQLFIDNSDLSVITSNDKRYVFQLNLGANLTTFSINGYDNNNLVFRPLKLKPFTESYFEISDESVQPDALFTTGIWREFDVNSIYKGSQYNILETVLFIHQSASFVNKTRAYEQLLNLMAENNHFSGKVVFDIAQYILEDLGDGPIFRLLPKPVQLICTGSPVKLFLQTKDREYWPFRYHWASNMHKNILPFSFDFDTTNRSYAITYDKDFQLSIPTHIASGRLTDIRQPKRKYDFVLYLSSDLTNVQIFCRYISGSTGNPSTALMGSHKNQFIVTDFYFVCNTLEQSSYTFFSVEEY